MALKEYLGAVVFEVDGREYEIIDLSINHDTGKKLVKTMNRKGRALGFCQGIQTWEISMTAAIPKDDPMDFDSIEGAKLTIYPLNEGGKRESYLDCISQKDSRKYSADNEARVDFTILALDKIEE